ncbi:hypothetical protein ACFSQ7_29485 [Paenibacillus rhizoplanae]
MSRGFRGMGPGGGFGPGKLKFDEEEAKPEISKSAAITHRQIFRAVLEADAAGDVRAVHIRSAGAAPSLLIQQIIDRALPDKNLQLLFLLVAASLATTVVSGLLGVLQNYLNSFISQNIVHDMKKTRCTAICRACRCSSTQASSKARSSPG